MPATEHDPLRDSIFKLGELAPVPLEATGWPEGVFVRKLDASEAEELERAGIIAKTTYGVPVPDNFQAMVLVRALCDSTGKRLFENHDVVKLSKLPQEVIAPAFEQAVIYNGLREGATEEAAKNSDSGPGSDSSSTSPDTSAEPSKS